MCSTFPRTRYLVYSFRVTKFTPILGLGRMIHFPLYFLRPKSDYLASLVTDVWGRHRGTHMSGELPLADVHFSILLKASSIVNTETRNGQQINIFRASCLI